MKLPALLLAGLAVAGCSRLPQPQPTAYHPSDADVSVTRIVHGSLVVSLGGQRVLVDPWFYSGRMVRQAEPIGLLPSALPELDAIVLTHGHSDHFDARALGELAERVPRVIAPPALAERLHELRFARVIPLEWWQQTTLGDVTVTAVPARHSTPENGYLLKSPSHTAYLAGDTRLPPDLDAIAAAAPDLDVAVLPIGGRRLIGMLREMGPEQAAEAAAVLHPRRVIPVAYGASSGIPLVWWYARNPVQRFRRAAAKHGLGPGRIVVLEPGESWHDWGGGAADDH